MELTAEQLEQLRSAENLEKRLEIAKKIAADQDIDPPTEKDAEWDRGEEFRVN